MYAQADQVDVASCINVMYGTLLKLYSMGAKVPTFTSRVAMTCRLMHLSSLPREDQARFLAAHPSLVRICFMEYSLNALCDWLPCEKDLMLRVCPSMKGYWSVAASMCDMFRWVKCFSEFGFAYHMLSSGSHAHAFHRQEAIQDGWEDWKVLNKFAAAGIDRCIRICKFKMNKIVYPVFKHLHVASNQFRPHALCIPRVECLVVSTGLAAPCAATYNKSTGKRERDESATSDDDEEKEATRKAENQLVEALAESYACGRPSNFYSAACSSSCCAGRISDGLLSSCKTIHEAFSIHPLPEVVMISQYESLDAMHGACEARKRSACRMSFCLVCAINGKGFQNKLRMCSVTGELSCISCRPGTVVTVGLLGTMMRIAGSYFYMCPCCTGLRVFTGDGSDFDRMECPCWQFGDGRGTCIAAFNSSAAASVGLRHSSRYLCMHATGEDVSQSVACIVCGSKSMCTRARLTLVHVQRRVVRRVNFCRKHAPPDHILHTITSFEEMEAMFERRFNSSSGGEGGGSSSRCQSIGKWSCCWG